MKTINSPEFSRNYGFINEAEQEALFNANIAIAGVGGDGFQLGLKLAQKGVQHFSIADPEIFEKENTNRVPGATQSTYGRNKAEVFQERVHDINPDAVVKIWINGVQKENVEEFMHGATLVLDESELTHLEIGTMIARQARKQGIPNLLVMNIGFAAQATSFRPSGGKTFEQLMGIPNGMPLDEVCEMKVKFERCLPYIPRYGDIRTLIAAQEGAPLPSIAEGVDVASALGTTQAFLHIVHVVNNRRPPPTWAPRFKYLDSYTCRGGDIYFPLISYYARLSEVIIRNSLGCNPKANYTEADRKRREGNHITS